jgi:hypothetical protein
MTTGPENPYGGPPPSPYQPPAPPPPPQYGAYPPQPYGAPGYPPGYVATPQNEGLAVAAMVIGIVSLVLACGYGIGLLGSPAALVMGRISMKRIDRSGGQLGGRGMAQAGFILGIIGSILLVLTVVVLVVVVVAAANGAFDETSGY